MMNLAKFLNPRKPKPIPEKDFYEITENLRGEFFVYINYTDSGFRFKLNDSKAFNSRVAAEAYIEEQIYRKQTNKETVIWKQSAG